MDLADIPAAAALLGAELSSASAESARSASAGAESSATRLHDLSNYRHIMAMDPNTSASAATSLLGAAHFYPGHASFADASMAQNYYAQNLANFAGFMPMYGFGMFAGGPPPSFLGGQLAPPLYDMDATALQNQIAAQFTQATPEQQAVYYESVRQQLDTAASGLNDDQKQALLRYDPTLSFSMKPLDLLDRDDGYDGTQTMTTALRGSGKRPRAASGASSVGAATKKPRKNKASSCEPSAGMDGMMGTGFGLLNEDTTGSSSGTTTPRQTPRGRPPKVAAHIGAGGVELTPSGKKKSMTPQAEEMRARKAKMTWPKGTFIIRLQDVKVRNGRNHIWLVDNHQLLQRYNNDTGGMRADGSRVYHKTDRYTGWLCHEGFHYFPLYDQKHILRQDGDTVTVLFPSEQDLQQAIEYQEQETKRREDAKEAEEPVYRPLPPSLRNQPALFMQQQQALQLQLQRAHSTPSATSMNSKMDMTSVSSSSMEREMHSGMGPKIEMMEEMSLVMESSPVRRTQNPSSTMRRQPVLRIEQPRGGRNLLIKTRKAHPDWHTSSPKASHSRSASDLQSTSRGLAQNEMPLLSRQDVDWGEHRLDELPSRSRANRLHHHQQQQEEDDPGMDMMDGQSSRREELEEKEEGEWEDMSELSSFRGRLM